MQPANTEILMVILVATAIILLLILTVAFFIVSYQRRMMAQKLRLQDIEAEAHRQRLAAIVETQESERMRIARDLHDGVGALLSTVKMSLNRSKRKLAKDGLDASLDESTDLLDVAIGSVREISHDLLPPSLETLGLVATLEQLAERTERLSGIPYRYHVKGEQRRLPIRTELILYRVVQELTANSLKHSQATQMGLELNYEPAALRLRFSDDGIGYDLAAMKVRGAGLGLMGIESRIEALGGGVAMQPATGKGAVTEVWVPA